MKDTNRSSKETQLLKEFGHNLRKARETKGYTQEQFARIAGFSRSYYTEIETGKRNLSFLNLIKIIESLEVDVNTLFDNL